MRRLTPEEQRLLQRSIGAGKPARCKAPDVQAAYSRFLAEYERRKAAGFFPNPEVTDAIVYGRRPNEDTPDEERPAAEA